MRNILWLFLLQGCASRANEISRSISNGFNALAGICFFLAISAIVGSALGRSRIDKRKEAFFTRLGKKEGDSLTREEAIEFSKISNGAASGCFLVLGILLFAFAIFLLLVI